MNAAIYLTTILQNIILKIFYYEIININSKMTVIKTVLNA